LTLRVQDPSHEIEERAAGWAVVEALMGGTAAMRKAGESLLPKWPGEDDSAHRARLKTATLFPAYRRTVQVMASKPFSKALSCGEDVPPKIRELCENVDLQGRNLHAFAAEAFERAVAYGLAGILVDYPKVEGVKTLADEARVGARPYMALIGHGAILGWKTALIGGAWKLTQIRLAEEYEAPDGPYGVKCIKRVRVLEPGRYELWQEPEDKTKSTDYVLIEEGTTTLKDIPFVPIYGLRDEFMEGDAPLLDVAYLNVKHWQAQSDQDTLMHVARVPILTVSGVDDDQFQVTVGGSAAVRLPTGAAMAYVEHSGAAIGAGRESLQDLEQQMIQAGAELLVKQPGSRTATESAADNEGNRCTLQRIAEVFEDALATALQYMADWLSLPSGGRVALFADYGASSLGQASGQLVLAMQQGGLIDKATAILEMQRRGELDAGLDPDTVLDQVSAEGPSLGAMSDPNAIGQ
jgi:hypothetical protein